MEVLKLTRTKRLGYQERHLKEFLFQKDNGISLSEESLTLSFADQVLNAETLQALDTLSSNHSFASTNENNNKLRRMFPDSQIAKKFSLIGDKNQVYDTVWSLPLCT